ncbi:hypothetical protein [Kitasatospora purpeofusca]|uniref:Uncharacterized protein n=1 Tax=Kitasatospora purpeofusca TaxID=67352 RepID=A0ABZ1TRN0_9ACTN|nr:hypothetical protein [Kitasatospora purpeofusca]
MMTSPASAAEGWSTYSADKSTIGPGETLTITMALTNTETTDISFAYEYDRSPSGSFLSRQGGPFNPPSLQGHILY